jgi:hypothetical protein
LEGWILPYSERINVTLEKGRALQEEPENICNPEREAEIYPILRY